MPQLPVELWWYILRLAVEIPGIFETKWDHSPDFLIWHRWVVSPSNYSASLRTKLTICLVSRTWREIGVQLLYEYLYFTNSDVALFRKVSKLVAIFEQHAGQRGYGRSTKRVEVYSQFSDSFPSLVRLLELCYNIRIFNAPDCTFTGAQQATLSSIFQRRFSHSLRQMSVSLHRYGDLCLPDVPLETLELSTEYSAFFTVDPPPAIATVTTFSLYHTALEDMGRLLSWRFPALRHLTFLIISVEDFTLLKSFMTTHGPQLHSLYLHNYLETYSTLVQKFLAQAPNLRRLTLSPIHVDWPPPGTSFPSITHIAFESARFEIASEIEAFISASIFPGLQCIRFLRLDNFEMWSDEDLWLSLLEAGSKRNIRFENIDGHSLNNY